MVESRPFDTDCESIAIAQKPLLITEIENPRTIDGS